MKVIRSSDAALRLDAALRFIDAFPPSTEILIVGATRDAADDFAREASVRRGATFGLHRYSLTQLAAKLAAADLAAAGFAPSTSLGVEAIAARVVFESRQRGELSYVTPVADLPGFPRALAGTATDLRLAGVESQSLLPLPDPCGDLSRLVRRMEDCMAESHVADRATLLRTAAMSVAAGGTSESLVAGRPVLLLDVPVESAAEREFISGLAQRASDMAATIPAGDEATWKVLQSLPGAEAQAHSDGESPTPLGRLHAYLFAASVPRLDPAAPVPRQVHFFSAPGEARECIEIARRILEEARIGTRFDRIAIVLRTPELYSGLLETALRRAGVPAFFSRGTRSPDPSGRAFIALLNCAREGLSARRFAEYLSLAQVPSPDPSGGPPTDRRMWMTSDDESMQAFVPGMPASEDSDDDSTAEVKDPESTAVLDGTLRAPWSWERLLVESAVIGGKSRWQRRLAGLRAEYRLKLEALAAEDAEEPRLKAIERDLQNLEHLRSFALPVIDELAAFPPQASWGEWLEVFERLAPRVLRRPQRVLALLAELRPMSAVGPVTLDEVCTVLSESLTIVREPPPERRYGRVLIATPDQMRGRSLDVVFVPGLAERMFPQRLREDPLLLDAIRIRLGADLQTREQRSGHERLRLRLASGAAKKAIWFSYPRMDLTESRPRVASFYALEIQRALTGSVPDIDALEQRAFDEGGARLAWPAPADARLAIDTVEHDLAILGPLLRHPDSSFVRGRARYLLELNPHLARSLRTRWARWHHPKWSSYDGLCGLDQAPPEVLAGYRLKIRPYSVSALQKFAVCPYQFLLSAIHRLEPREESVPLDQMDPLTRGHMFHSVQAALMRDLKMRGALPVTPATLSRALDTLEGVLARVEAEYREELAPAIDRVWRDEVESMRGDLRGWLHNVAAAGGDWHPVHFEFGFGLRSLDNLDPESVDDPVTLDEGWLLHGVIDLIERRANSDEFRVTDHKTGSNYTRDGMVVGGGEVLQPVLYGLAVEKLLGRVVESRLSYCTSTGRFSERVVSLDEGARQAALKVLAIVDAAIEKGMLLPSPREGRCNWCDFRIVCGPYEEVRSGRKPPLPDLIRLREMP
jgi:CRISPR/Cas system-associated exonuclease Cas4 (RecB family)